MEYTPSERGLEVGLRMVRTVVRWDSYLEDPKCPCKVHLAVGRLECYDVPPGYPMEDGYRIPDPEHGSDVPYWALALQAECEYAIEIGEKE